MLKRIKQLPEFIANQIAAGEVIERPASVVKELLENAFDARATQVSVEIGFGGLNLIKISDNGTGILADDLLLAIAPHATSKINELSDLYAIQSMGFRGEALASISSVSRLVIRSKPDSQEHAMMLEVMNQKITTMPCARSQGTTIEVHDLFFNAPVRKKFLRSERGEFQAIEMVVKRVAMSAPAVAISLTHNGKLQWQVNPATCEQSMRARITKLLGKKFIDGASYFDVEHAGMRLYGWLGDVNYQRSQNDGMWIYLNDRMIKDKLLHHAIKQVYASVLHPGRYPVCLLYLTVNPAEVDVNVHPTKHEVRFEQSRLVHDFIVSQLSRLIGVPAMVEELPIVETTTLNSDNQLIQLSAPAKETIAHEAGSLEAFSSSNYSTAVFQVRESRVSEGNRVNHAAQFSLKPDSPARELIAIDKQFSLILLQAEVFLVNLVALRAYWFSSYLNQQTLPWTARPLLVPIHYIDLSRDFNDCSNELQLLKQLGIETVMLHDSKLVVRSLPGVVPQLEIHPFLVRFFSLESPSWSQCVALLVEHFSHNPTVIGQVQQMIFWTDLMSDFETLMQVKGLIKRVSPALCQEILHG